MENNIPEIEPLTKEERAWIKKLQKVLDSCPSKRLEAGTGGDPEVAIYDKVALEAYMETLPRHGSDDTDPYQLIQDIDGFLARVRFPFKVVGWAV